MHLGVSSWQHSHQRQGDANAQTDELIILALELEIFLLVQ